MAKKISIGAQVPNFILKSQDGEEVELYKELESHIILLFFYPADETPGCIKESCKFSAYTHNYEQYNVKLYGVSSDDAQSHQDFIKKYDLTFDLLSDTKSKVRKKLGIKNHLFFIPGRETLIIGQDKKLLWRFRSLNNPMDHVHESLSFLKKVED